MYQEVTKIRKDWKGKRRGHYPYDDLPFPEFRTPDGTLTEYGEKYSQIAIDFCNTGDFAWAVKRSGANIYENRTRNRKLQFLAWCITNRIAWILREMGMEKNEFIKKSVRMLDTLQAKVDSAEAESETLPELVKVWKDVMEMTGGNWMGLDKSNEGSAVEATWNLRLPAIKTRQIAEAKIVEDEDIDE